MKTLIVNIFGSPGVGKSSFAADLFARLKYSGISSELVTEYAKRLVWEEDWRGLRNQLQILSEAVRTLETLDGKVRVIVNEQCVLNSIVFVTPESRINTDYFAQYVLSLDEKYGGLNFFVDREPVFTEEGARVQKTKEESDMLKERILGVLDMSKRPYERVSSCDSMFDVVIGLLENDTFV